QSGGAAAGKRWPGSGGVPSSSAARALAIVTRNPSSTAITPVATLASTCAVRRRASSSAAWLRRTSAAIRSKADITGANSRGAPGAKPGGAAPRPTAIAASRNAATGRASAREHAVAVHPQVRVEPVAEVHERAGHRIGAVEGQRFRRRRGVAQRLPDQQVPGPPRLVPQSGEAPRGERDHGEDEEGDQ